MTIELTPDLRRWIRNWGHAYPDIVNTWCTPEGLKAIREEGRIWRLKEPTRPSVSDQKGPIRPWAQIVWEREVRVAAKKRWPALQQEIIAGALKPSRIEYLIANYGFVALEQFEG